MKFLHIGLVAATIAAPSKRRKQVSENELAPPLLGKRKESELEHHYEIAARETHYSDSLFTLAELAEIDRELNPSRVTTATVRPRPDGEWARERVMLFEYLQANPGGPLPLEPLMEQIQMEIPGTAITMERLERDRANTIRAAVVPSWFHEAMMSLETLTDSWDPEVIPLLIAQAPPGITLLRNSEGRMRLAARIWFKYCVRPTRTNQPGGPFCGQSDYPEHYVLSRAQFNRYLEDFKRQASAFF